jgi:ribonuclease P protein subunit POP4
MAPKDSDIALSLLSRAHSPDSANRIFTEKIKTRPLLLRPSEPSNAQHHRRIERQRKLSARRKKLKPKPLSSRAKRSLCLYDVPPEEQKYSIYEPLHRMWVGYIQEVLGENCMPVSGSAAAKLCSADFHGAELEVVRSRCVSRVGVRGIVVKDSKFAFEIITKSDTRKLIPKEHTIFKFVVPTPRKEGEAQRDLVFELHGDQFIYRAADRANRKFKSHFLPDL